MKKILLSIAMLTVATSMTSMASIAKAEFNIPSVERSVNRGLLVDIFLKCKSDKSAKASFSIMSYSKTEKLFCTAKKNCYHSARYAAMESCNGDKTQTADLKSK